MAESKKMVAENMSLVIVEAVIASLKNASKKPYAEMTESDKRNLHNQIDFAVKSEISKAVDIIVADKRTTLRAQVDQVVFKDGVKIVLKAGQDGASHDIADSTGQAVLIVITGAEKYKKESAPKPEKDQKPLFDKSTEPEGAKAPPRTKRSRKPK